jgi:hypothetical protein
MGEEVQVAHVSYLENGVSKARGSSLSHFYFNNNY